MKTKKLSPAIQAKDAFMKIAALEPRLLPILAEIETVRRQSKGKTRICANEHWYGVGGFKARMHVLVGWGRGKKLRKPKKPDLKGAPLPLSWFTKAQPLPPGPLYTCEAYAAVYKYLYSRLPDCRNCGEFTADAYRALNAVQFRQLDANGAQ
jgi:hypothetical protein